MERELAHLKNERSQIKAALTRLRTYFHEKFDGENLSQLHLRLSKGEPMLDKFDNLQTQIELLDASEAGEIEREAFENNYFEIISEIQQYLDSRQNAVMDTSHDSKGQHSMMVETAVSHVKLPTLSLPTFEGQYDKWLLFKDTFISVIDENEKLSEIQKFQYLRSSLKGEALQLLVALETSADNYKIAWKLLQNRYENKKLIINTHLKGLFELSPIIKENHVYLRQFVDEIRTHTRALQALGEPVREWNTILIYLAANKLDITSRREWETHIGKTQREIVTLEQLLEFLEKRCQTLELMEKVKPVSTVDKHQHQHWTLKRTDRRASGSFTAVVHTCAVCNKDHNIYSCEEFLKKSPSDRIIETKKLKLCMNCLRTGHIATYCRSSSCRKCGRKHNTLLHLSNTNLTSSATATSTINTNEATEDLGSTATITTHCVNKKSSHILLSTAIVYIFDSNGSRHECRALLDSGSQAHFITQNLVNKLKLDFVHVLKPISGISQSKTNINQEALIKIQSKYNNSQYLLNCLILSKITDHLPQVRLNQKTLMIPETIALADNNFDKPGSIDLLLGAEIFWKLICDGRIHLGQEQPILQNTQLGWIISGPIATDSVNTTLVCQVAQHTTLNKQIEKFWQLEEVSSPKPLYSPEEQLCERHFLENYHRTDDGRFVVRLPVKESLILGDSLDTATSRLHWVERKLTKNLALKSHYIRFMNEYLHLNHMSKSTEEVFNNSYYLPHHPVEKQDSLTTKVRVVFDASCKSKSGVSLNDILMVGPNIQEDLFNIIIRFRGHQFVITADIEMMYRQILVDARDTHLQQILWRESVEEPISSYILHTVTYGTSCAPFLATRCLQQLAELEGHNFPLAKRALESDFYMDDVLTGASTVKEAQELQRQLTQLLSLGKFNLRKWRSNSFEIIQHLRDMDPKDELMLLTKQETLKTLGIYWNSSADTLRYKVSQASATITKRTILSQISKLFDPLGLLGPVITTAKWIMQQLWQQKLDWDEPVPEHIATAWTTFCKDLPLVNNIEPPRNVNPKNSESSIVINGYCDASEKAYGACIFVTSRNQRGEQISILLCSKGRVAPLRTLTLPKLELSAALLLARLVVISITSLQKPVLKVNLWTDSTIALSWIRTMPHELKQFTANRVQEIQKLTEGFTWYHISSKNNPADILSRGSTVAQLIAHELWWFGPSPAILEFEQNNQPMHIKPELEIKSSHCSLIAQFKAPEFLYKYSSFRKLERVIAYCYRFLYNCKNTEKQIKHLLVTELDRARCGVLKLVQREAFARELVQLQNNHPVNPKSPLYQLKPFLDKDGLIKVGGRLQFSDIQAHEKHPILLPKTHHITTIILRDSHRQWLHCGPEQLLANIRSTYWPLSGRNLAKKIVRQCVDCFRHNPKPVKYEMGDLPKSRVCGNTRPFTTCGVDYAGPIQLREGPRRRGKPYLYKAYVAVFVCFRTKAVHLELVTSLTTESFIAALRRFVARRGVCAEIHSDNATNFMGANRELREILEFVQRNNSLIASELANHRIEWKFIPPRSPSFGGLWETAVKSMKAHFSKVTKNLILTYEECYTLLTGIEAIMNSRPLIALSTDPNDMSVLTPSHFLIGDSLIECPDRDYSNTPESYLSRWQHLQKVRQHFWIRWHKDYLHQLQTRYKWRGSFPSISIDTLVLLIEDRVPPSSWLLGRVVNLHPGEDGVVRVVTVKTTTGTFKRSVRKVCVVPTDTDYPNVSSIFSIC